MHSDLYRIVYCSRNEMTGTSDQVIDAQLGLLEAARLKNKSLDITGALISEAGLFAQVLEGPQHAVAQLFGRVEQDNRHSDVVIALRGHVAERTFPDWSMAFGDGETSSDLPRAQPAIDAVYENREGAGENLLALLKTLVVRENTCLL